MEASKRDRAWPDQDGDYGVTITDGTGTWCSYFGASMFRDRAEAVALAVIDAVNGIDRPASPSVPTPGPLSVEWGEGLDRLLHNGEFVRNLVRDEALTIAAQLAIPAAIAALGPCPPWAEYGIVATGEALRKLAEAATPGPWGWRGQTDGSIELRSGGRRVVTTIMPRPCLDGKEDGSEWWTTADACDACRAEARKIHDPFVDYDGCERPAEATDTIWLYDDERHAVSPANKWAVREVSYRNDVVRVDHPDAAFIAAANPAVIAELLDRVEAAEAALIAACTDGWADGPAAAAKYLNEASERVS